MENSMSLREVKFCLDEYSRTLVGILLKRLDILVEPSMNLTSKQIQCLYKKLTKENIYELTRAYKKLIDAQNVSERIIFEPNDK